MSLNNPPLSLELICGQSTVHQDHPGYFDASENMTHPLQEEIIQLASEYGIDGRVEGSFQDDSFYSDAYLYFYPKDIEIVEKILNDVGYPGDILDVEVDALSQIDMERVRAFAHRNGLSIEER